LLLLKHISERMPEDQIKGGNVSRGTPLETFPNRMKSALLLRTVWPRELLYPCCERGPPFRGEARKCAPRSLHLSQKIHRLGLSTLSWHIVLLQVQLVASGHHLMRFQNSLLVLLVFCQYSFLVTQRTIVLIFHTDIQHLELF
jgi:hypothetical protein